MNRSSETTIPVAGGRIPVTADSTEAFTPAVSVWLVDDNDGFRATLADVLGRQRGIRCARDFSSPDAVLSALASHLGPDVILLDVQMRDRNGLDAIGPIKSLARETQVLMLTSSYDPEGHQRAIAEGASDFLLKSYTPDEIAQRIRNPSRRVNARRSKPANAACPTRLDRGPAKAGTQNAGSTKLRLGFFRRWLRERCGG
jgi:DNA-binding response OmpR family regulator